MERNKWETQWKKIEKRESQAGVVEESEGDEAIRVMTTTLGKVSWKMPSMEGGQTTENKVAFKQGAK